MRYPNALAGIRKVFIEELLSIITVFTFGAMTVFSTLQTTASDGEPYYIFVAVFGLISIVVTVAAYILLLIGIIKAMKDNKAFRTSLIYLVLSVIILVLSIVFQKNTSLADVLSTIGRVTHLGVTVYFIQGIMNLAKELDNEKIIKKGNRLLILLLIIYTLTIFSDVLSYVFKENEVTLTIAISFALLASILYLVQYFLFISYLSKAIKMLKES